MHASRSIVRVLVLLPSAAILLGACSSTSSQVKHDIDEAREASKHKQFDQAIERYEKALARANQSTPQEVLSQIRLEWAAAVARQQASAPTAATIGSNDPATGFKFALEHGTDEQKAKAANNLAVLYLQQGNAEDALKVYQGSVVNLAAAQDREVRAIYEYGYGRALELNGNAAAAYDHYCRAGALSKKLATVAGLGAARTASTRPSDSTPPLSDLLPLVQGLLEQDEARAAARQALVALRQRGQDPRAPEMAVLLARAYVQIPMTPLAYRQDQRQNVQGAAAACPALAGLLTDIDVAFDGALVPAFSHAPVFSQSFFAWQGPGRADVFSKLLEEIARSDDAAGLHKEALARYAAAWRLDRSNADLAYLCAASLRDHLRELDPDGRLTNDFIASAMDARGAFYASGPRTEEQWETLLRLHLILGEIFEARGQWGWTDPDRADVHSAAYQWRRALAAQQQIQQLRSVQAAEPYPPWPNIYAHLGECYGRSGQSAKAQGFYLDAAAAFAAKSNRREATTNLRKAKALGSGVSSETTKRIEEIEAAIEQISPSDGASGASPPGAAAPVPGTQPSKRDAAR